MKLRTLDSISWEGQRALVRCDLNIAFRPDGTPADVSRMERLRPTIAELVGRGAKVVLASHLGRPGGTVDPDLSLTQLVEPLGETLGVEEIALLGDCAGDTIEAITRDMQPGGIALLENLRFHPGEEANDPEFAVALARLGDAYINDAFSVAHREHASVVGVPRHLDSVAGRAFETEVDMLGRALDAGDGSVMAIVGGSKVSSKIVALRNLVGRVDALAVGGAMANTFLAAQGLDLGKSLVEPEMFDEARAIIEAASRSGCELMLPVDVVVSDDAAAEPQVVRADQVPSGQRVYDIGPETCDAYGNRLTTVQTLLWSGPLGLYEVAPFDQGTAVVGRTAAMLTRGGVLTSVAGGGDTAAALSRLSLGGGFSYVSVAGSAFLRWVEGRSLPGLLPLAA